MLRGIKNILYFREDISPFLIHLTKQTPDVPMTAKNVLEAIIDEKQLKAGEEPISDAKFGVEPELAELQRQYCRAISFTETPLNEIHCLLEIWGRSCQLKQYGLVFIKEKLRKRGVSPVLYLNNEENDKLSVVEALFELRNIDDDAAKQILPLIASFGKRLKAEGNVDFSWEREWRYPSIRGNFEFTKKDVFVGICPDNEINYFEMLFPEVKFIDCQKNIKHYAKKLVDSKDRFSDFKFSVV